MVPPACCGRFAGMSASPDAAGPASSLLTSPLHERHVALGAKLAEFGGWSMPLEYAGSGVVKEHTSVREAVGIFDVSHLGKATLRGPGAADLVNRTLSNDLGKIGPGRAQYTLCCDAQTGGIVDDLIAYLHADDHVFLVPNAANTSEVLRRLSGEAPAGGGGGHEDERPAGVAGPGSGARRGGGAGGGAGRGGSAARPRLHVVRGGGLGGCAGCGLSDGLPGRTRLRAGLRERHRRSVVGCVAGGRGAVRPAAVRPRGSRHPADRDGLPAPRSGHQPRRHSEPGPARLGCGLEEGPVLGQGRAGRREGAGGYPDTPRSGRRRPRDPASGDEGAAGRRRTPGPDHVGHVLADTAEGRRPCARGEPGDRRCRGLRRRTWSARDLHLDPSAVRAAGRPRALTYRHATTSAVVKLTSTHAPSTSPVIPPKRRTHRQHSAPATSNGKANVSAHRTRFGEVPVSASLTNTARGPGWSRASTAINATTTPARSTATTMPAPRTEPATTAPRPSVRAAGTIGLHSNGSTSRLTTKAVDSAWTPSPREVRADSAVTWSRTASISVTTPNGPMSLLRITASP